MSLHKPTKPAAVCMIASQPILAFLCPAALSFYAPQRPQKRVLHHNIGTRAVTRAFPLSPPQQTDNFFIGALVQAASCRRHARHKSTWRGASDGLREPQMHRRKAPLGFQASVRGYSDDAQNAEANVPKTPSGTVPTSQEYRRDYKKLVRMYQPWEGRLETLKEEEDRERLLQRQEEEEEEEEEEDRRAYHSPWPNYNEYENSVIGNLEALLAQKYPSPDEAHKLYTSLSYPRVAYLHYSTIRRLLNCLSTVEHPTEAAMIRYLGVIDDMKATNIPVHFMDWSTAIHFAGRCYRRVTNAEVGSALLIWREMEQEAGVRASHITFNILFDIASKAGKYQLATMISKEMARRKMDFDRHFRAGMIMLCGMKGDGEAVRRAYHDLVDAGEIIDTAIMNCVLTALLQAGEPMAAEQVFARMKRMHNERESPRPAPTDWRQQRELGKLLRKAARELREDPEGRQLLQDQSPVGPDYGTYKVLIAHYCTAGNIDRVTELIEEMTVTYGIPVRGDMYFRLFEGFDMHGGVRYSSWTKAKLESTWEAYLSALDEDETGFFLGGRFVVKVMYAYSRITSTARAMEVWEEIQLRWEPSLAEKETLSKIFRRVFPDQM